MSWTNDDIHRRLEILSQLHNDEMNDEKFSHDEFAVS